MLPCYAINVNDHNTLGPLNIRVVSLYFLLGIFFLSTTVQLPVFQKQQESKHSFEINLA